MGWRGCVRVGSNSLWDESFKARGHLKCQRLVAKLIVIMKIKKKKTSYTQTGLSALAESKDQDKTDLYIPLPRPNVVSSTSWLKMLFLFHNEDKSCFIKGYCFAPNEPNPQDWCQQCLPEINKADWTKRQGTFDTSPVGLVRSVQNSSPWWSRICPYCEIKITSLINL